MSLKSGLLAVLACVLVGVTIGAGIGLVLGLVAPDFFAALFRPRLPEAPPLDPVQIGLGLGLVNGALWGAGVGCVVVLATAWVEGRKATAC